MKRGTNENKIHEQNEKCFCKAAATQEMHFCMRHAPVFLSHHMRKARSGTKPRSANESDTSYQANIFWGNQIEIVAILEIIGLITAANKRKWVWRKQETEFPLISTQTKDQK